MPVERVSDRYSVLEDGRILDIQPMESGKWPLVLKNGKWTEFEGTLGDVTHSRPMMPDVVKKAGL
jgi:hypothetical protein